MEYKFDKALLPTNVCRDTYDDVATQWHISHEHAFYEFSRNDGFRELLSNGMFRYVENAFVINDPKYIWLDENGTSRLTTYAIRYPQECTLLFEYTVSVVSSSTDQSRFPPGLFGFLTRVETDYMKLPRYYPNVQNDTVYDTAKAKEQALQKALENVREEFMTSRQSIAQAIDFWERVEQIRDAKGFSKSKFKRLSGLDDQTVSHLGKGDTVSMRNGIATCFGLDLNETDSKDLLALAKLALGNDKESLAYVYVLSTFQGYAGHFRQMIIPTAEAGKRQVDADKLQAACDIALLRATA